MVKYYSGIGWGDRHGHFNCGEALLCDTLIVVKHYSGIGEGGRHGHFNCGEVLFWDRMG